MEMHHLCPRCPYRTVELADKKTTGEIITELIQSKTAANRRQIYVESLKHYLTRFALEFPDLCAVRLSHLESWLLKFESMSSRQTWKNRVSTLFAFAFKRGHIVHNPCIRLESISVDRKAPVILTLEQVEKLLAACPSNIMPYLALALFAGIRPDEIRRMKWEDVDFVTAHAKVDGKTRRRRIVPLESKVIYLLAPFVGKSGPVAPSRSTIRRWQRKARELIGGKWTADILRHTAASYLLAKHGDAGKVATMLGNSPQILLTHYNNPVTREAGEKFWSLTGKENGESKAE